jgi:hypothetical protein
VAHNCRAVLISGSTFLSTQGERSRQAILNKKLGILIDKREKIKHSFKYILIEITELYKQ